MSRSKRKQQIRSLMEKTGKRARGAANILNRQDHLTGLQQQHGEEGGIHGAPQSSLTIRHVYLTQPTEWEVEVFALNQTVSTYSAKLKGWLAPAHRLDPHYARAYWTEERRIGQQTTKRSTDDELRTTVAKAMAEVEPFGHLLVVHAPGLVSLIWSDHPLPRVVNERIPEGMFGPPMKAIPRQPINDGPAPSWWPDTGRRKDALIRVRDEDDHDREMRLFAQCSSCGAVTKTNGFDAQPALFETNDGTTIKRAIEARLEPGSSEPHRGQHAAIIEALVPVWRDELRRSGCSHV